MARSRREFDEADLKVFKFFAVVGSIGLLVVLGFLLDLGFGKMLFAFVVGCTVISVPFWFVKGSGQEMAGYGYIILAAAGLGIMVLIGLGVMLGVMMLLS